MAARFVAESVQAFINNPDGTVKVLDLDIVDGVVRLTNDTPNPVQARLVVIGHEVEEDGKVVGPLVDHAEEEPTD